jgi:TM2 domain-containing membrane protein YozV
MTSVNSPTKPKSRTVYIILGIFLGFLGIHNFYVGRNAEGGFQLFLFCFLFWTVLVPAGLFIWGIIEVITVKTDGSGKTFR